MLSGFNGIISYGLGTMDGQAGVRGWSWILIVPGAITILLAVPLYIFISDFPEKAKWLQPDEKQFFYDRLMQDRGEEVEKPGFKHILDAVTDWKAWLLGLFLGLATMGGYVLAFFSPAIIQSLGYNVAFSQCLTSPPFVAATISALITAWAADKLHRRLPFLIGNSLLAALGFILMGYGPNNGSKLTGIFFGVIGVQTSIPTSIAFLVNNIPGSGKRAVAVAMMTMQGGMGGIIGSLVFRSQDAPRYRPGFFVCIGGMALSVLASSFLWLYFQRQNEKAEKEGEVLEGVPGFRYTL
jgi:sugar phosphate permease